MDLFVAVICFDPEIRGRWTNSQILAANISFTLLPRRPVIKDVAMWPRCDIEIVREFIVRQKTRVVHVIGAPGSGKTTLLGKVLASVSDVEHGKHFKEDTLHGVWSQQCSLPRLWSLGTMGEVQSWDVRVCSSAPASGVLEKAR